MGNMGGKRPGAGPKPLYKEPMVQVSIPLPASTVDALRSESVKSNVSIAALVRGYIPAVYFAGTAK